MDKCAYGCGQVGLAVQSNGKLCCSTRYNKCPAIRRKNSDGLKLAIQEGRHPGISFIATSKTRGWANGVTATTDTRVRSLYAPDLVFSYGGLGPHKKLLIKERGHVCEMCQSIEWLGNPITLEMDHIDGDRRNNLKNNLRLLCPNCHSTTPTWKGRNKRNKSARITDEEIMQAISVSKTINEAIRTLGISINGNYYERFRHIMTKHPLLSFVVPDLTQKISKSRNLSTKFGNELPFTKDELERLLWQYPTTTLAKQYGLSDNGLTRWIKKFGLTKPPRGYWAKKYAGVVE